MENPTPADPNPVNPLQPSAPPSEAAPQAPVSRGLGGWLRENFFPVLFTAFILGLGFYKGWNWIDIGKVVVGLGMVILIHELGHFLAAKWCDVHVETFSIGFGKPIPGCHFKVGETVYKLGWIPLGGYVKMVGEGEGADGEEAEEDPRSFKNKSVPQRMLIISAGVVMNLLLAGVCFMIAYSHGVEEKPPVIGWVDPGSPSWQAGIHSGTVIGKIDEHDRPMFDDIRPNVMGTSKGEKISLVVKDGPNGEPRTLEVEPAREEDALYPTIGVGPSWRPVLASRKQPGFKPYRDNTPAAQADPKFQGGDRVVGMTDPAQRGQVTDLPEGAVGYLEMHRRLTLLRSEPITFQVRRVSGELVPITVPPARMSVPGARMRMGRIVAVRAGSGAAQAGVRPGKSDSGDKLIAVEVDGDGRKTRFVSRAPAKNNDAVDEIALDPLRLPYDLGQLFAQSPTLSRHVKLTVQRLADGQHTEKELTLEAAWDDSARFDVELLATPNSPLSIPELGLAYQVDLIVEELTPVGNGPSAQESPAAKAGLQVNDVIKEVRPKYLKKDGDKSEVEKGDWQKIKPFQWAYVFAQMQNAEVKEFDVRVARGTGTVELTLPLVADNDWFTTDRGLLFDADKQLHQATDLFDAVRLGWYRTWRTVRVIYQNLYAMIFARVSPFTMSGPLTIASVSYSIAGENFWQFILFLGMINVNLAVINFLPIPALDGGHMVLLIYEGIRRKPAPEFVQNALLVLGVAFIVGLMLFVIFLDIQRLFF